MKIFLLFIFLFWMTPSFSQLPPPPPPVVAVSPTPVVFKTAEVVEPWAPPEWLKEVMEKAYSVPVIGPIAVETMKWLGVIASLLTALATAFFAVARVLSSTLKFAKFVELAVKVDAFYAKWAPYIKFFSMYNVQKKPEEEKKT